MVIGIDASRANKKHKSGTEWYAYYLIKALAQLDDKNEYILYTDQPLHAGLLDLTQENFSQAIANLPDKQGWQKITSPHNNFKGKVLRWPFRFLWTQGRLSLEMLWHRPDVLFVPAHALPVIHPQKSVVTIHDIGFKETEKLYSQDLITPQTGLDYRMLRLLIKIISRGDYVGSQLDYLHWSTQYALDKAKRIITISNFSKSEIAKYYQADSDKIKVIYNGYNDRLYKPTALSEATQAVWQKYGISQPYIFYVGRLEKKKNTDKLIEAFALVKQHHPEIKHKLVLVGDASFGFDEIKYQINEFNLNDDIVITGWVAEEDMPHIFSQATAFIFPSNYEGFGIPLLQAMACGTPIVASNIASIPEVAGSVALLFDQTKVHDMAEKIAKIILNQDLREQLIQAGLTRVKNFNWQICAQETLKVINEM
ncbi:MAG: glycosyltransferase family 1 protein [bacterium]